MNKPIPFLDLRSLHAPLKDEMMAVVSEIIDNAAFVGGAALNHFEKSFAVFNGCQHAVGVGNGTDAVRLALQALGIGSGKTVVTVPNTFIATTEAISHCGAKFAFVDVEPDTCLMDPQALEAYFAENTADAVVPVHLYGQCADMDAIEEVAQRHGAVVVADAAQAHGATYKGRPAGGLGKAAAFSFYPGKNLGACGEAGAVTTNDGEIAKKIAMLREHGQAEKHHHELEGTNSRLDALQAAFLSIKLKHLNEWNDDRRRISDLYDQAFATSDRIRPITIRPDNVPSRHLYVVHLNDREKVMCALEAQQIGYGLHYPISLHLQKCYAGLGLREGSYPHAENSARELLSLPLFPGMTAEQAELVAEAVLGAA
jgi:dTDP-4-amino-4,6-dideoxygalactose transaminase